MLRLKCIKCNNLYEVEESDLEHEISTSEERTMGQEKWHILSYEFVCKNSNCNNNIALEFNFWEYPQLVLNYSEYKEDGCIVLEEPNYQLFFEDYDFDNEQ